ncbi:hypothetical protein [Pyrobaculum sp.]|uniref:hypothetical protein n=1 Tax=Pyrobaculum sp. TaxID=2004705 RepID=UPI003D0E3D28
MLLALIRKGICGGGCGNLGQLVDNPLHDYLVIRLKTDEFAPDEYEPGKVSKDVVLRYRDKLCKIVLAIGDNNLHMMFLTTNPYLPEFALGPTMRGEDIIEYHTRAFACEP